jgi:hypothetical protein
MKPIKYRNPLVSSFLKYKGALKRNNVRRNYNNSPEINEQSSAAGGFGFLTSIREVRKNKK